VASPAQDADPQTSPLARITEALAQVSVHDVSPVIEPGMPMWFLHGGPEVTTLSRHDVEGAAANRVSFSEHTGSHVDAPFHFDPAGLTVELLPVDALLLRPFRVLDLRPEDPQAGELVDAGQLTAAEARSGGALAPGDIAVLQMGWDRYLPGAADAQPPGWWGRNQPGLSPDACELLVGREVSAVKDGAITSAHGHTSSFLPRGILIIEGLRRLADAPKTGLLCALPLKLAGGTGSPVRVVLLGA
jgi:arylformamidase